MAQADGDRRGRRWSKAVVLGMALGVSLGVEGADSSRRVGAGWEAWRSWLTGVALEFLTPEAGVGIDPNGGVALTGADPTGGGQEFEAREAGVGIDPDGRAFLVVPGVEPGSDEGR